MKQIELKKLQNSLREKFLKKGVKMVSPETIFFFQKILKLEKKLL